MGGLTFMFLQDGAYPPLYIVTIPSGQACEASADWLYPNDNNAHTVTVYVAYSADPVKYMVEPISLESSCKSKLLSVTMITGFFFYFYTLILAIIALVIR